MVYHKMSCVISERQSCPVLLSSERKAKQDASKVSLVSGSQEVTSEHRQPPHMSSLEMTAPIMKISRWKDPSVFRKYLWNLRMKD